PAVRCQLPARARAAAHAGLRRVGHAARREHGLPAPRGARLGPAVEPQLRRETGSSVLRAGPAAHHPAGALGAAPLTPSEVSVVSAARRAASSNAAATGLPVQPSGIGT